MAQPHCAGPSSKRCNATLRAPLRWLSCCVGSRALRRLASTSAIIRKLKRSTSARMIWRPTMNSPAPETTMMMNNNLASQLKQIGLCALPTQLDDFIARVTKARCSAHQILEELAKAEASERSRRSLERRLRISGIKRFKPMADFDWSWPAKIERDIIERNIIERALTLDFLSETRNLILVGRNGLGKTMIAQNIAHAAVLAGHTVLFRSAAALLEELHRQSPEGRRGKLRGYANVGLLCIDEVGYLSFDDKAADLLYEVVNRRYERKPVILTTNRPFKEWNEVFPTRRASPRCWIVCSITPTSPRLKATAIACARASRKPLRAGGRNDSRRLDPGPEFQSSAVCHRGAHPLRRPAGHAVARQRSGPAPGSHLVSSRCPPARG